jgi:nitrite reductase/ring-hydroxylating ferredoxin subunit
VDEKEFVSCIKENEIKEGQMKPVRVKGKAILLVKQGGQIFAVSNCCPHMGCSLDKGILREYMVMCPCHGWKFDVRNGQYDQINEVTLATYRCKTQNGKVFIELKNDA